MAKRRANNEGTLFQDSRGYWVAEVSLPDGKRRRKYSKKQSVVSEWLLLQRKALRDGLYAANDRMTVSMLLDRFLNDVVVHTLKPKTIDSYKYIIEKHIKPEIGYLKLTQVRPDHLQYLYSKKLESGLSKRTVQYIHAVIRRALNLAVKWGLIVRNPTDVVSAPKPPKKALKLLTEEQTIIFLEFVKNHRWYPIYLIGVATGMREGEILGLRWEDVDFKSSSISVNQTVESIRGRLSIGQPKTDKSMRTIPVPGFAMDVLKANQKVAGLIFTTSTGKPISPRNLLRHFHATLKKLGFERVTFQSLRHFHASYLLKENIHPKVVQERLGHSTITLTMDTYSSIMPGIQEEAAEKMNDFFKV